MSATRTRQHNESFTTADNNTSDSFRQELASAYEQYNDAIRRYIWARSRDAYIVDEVAANSFESIACWLLRNPLEPLSRPLVMTIVHRRLVDYWRTQSKQPATLTESEEIPIDPVNIDGTRALLDGMPLHYQRALVARYLLGLSVSEVSVLLSCSYAAAESTLARARRALKTKLHESVFPVDVPQVVQPPHSA